MSVDREKVVKGLECCMSEYTCGECPYKGEGECEDGGYYYSKAIEDALTLLREQEPEIVRCKDCKHCEYPQSEKEWCKKGHLHGKAENWFCADGERR